MYDTDYGYSYEESYFPPNEDMNNDERKKVINQLKMQSNVSRLRHSLKCYAVTGNKYTISI